MLIVPLVLLWMTPAEAAGFQAKTMRAPLSALEVERGLLMPKGWVELGLQYDHKVALGAWSPDGTAEEWDSARWTYTTQRADLRYGISQRAELYWSLPFHYVRLQNEPLGTDTSTFGLGDAHFGWKLEWFKRAAPTTSVVTDLDFKLPTGSESPGSFIGGPNTITEFVLGTGQLDAGLHVRARQQLGPVSLTGAVGYVRRFSGVTQYTLEVEEYQFLGRFKPGDEVRATFEPLVQIGPVAASGELEFRKWFTAAAGTTSGGFWPDSQLDPLAGTDGWALDVTPSLLVNVTRGVDVGASVGVPLRGEDLSFFPLEEISPTRGLTWSGRVELRY